jgi:hypothetical protein
MPAPAVDWSFHESFPRVKLWCRCGHVFRSHMTVTRIFAHGLEQPPTGFQIVTREPCPRCKSFHRVMRGERDDPSFDIRDV